MMSRSSSAAVALPPTIARPSASTLITISRRAALMGPGARAAGSAMCISRSACFRLVASRKKMSRLNSTSTIGTKSTWVADSDSSERMSIGPSSGGGGFERFLGGRGIPGGLGAGPGLAEHAVLGDPLAGDAVDVGRPGVDLPEQQLVGEQRGDR